MSDKIIIGKHTLESLTSGMYSDPYVVFREYIQNSVDSIDEAFANGTLQPGKERIIVHLKPADGEVIISDNGVGISTRNAEKVLISIGNSKKTSESSRGFRGIGRLAALSYCKRLVFITSQCGENKATIITVDAEKLAMLLMDSTAVDTTIVDVLQKVYSVTTKPEKENAHYFVAKIEGIDDHSGLMNQEEVIDYLSQNTPVPYSPDFIWGKEIVKRLRKEGYGISTYNISVQYGNSLIPVFKPYKDEILVDKGKNIYDKLQDIEIIKIARHDQELAAIGWLAKTNYYGSIYDRAVKGIRLRKGNILIGDYQTLNVIFKDARFNGWTMGEIFAIDNRLIPNARRDNFEKNQAYFGLFEQLSTIAARITKEIRSASLKRNAELSRAIEQLDKASQMANDALQNGITRNKKGALTHVLKTAKDAVSISEKKDDTEEEFQEIAFEELDMLIGKLKGATSYKALNTIDSLNNTEKKILERVFNTILNLNIKNGNKVIEAIINDFSGN